MLPFGLRFIGTLEWVWEMLDMMSLSWTSGTGLLGSLGTSIASWLSEEMTSAIDLELVMTSGL